MKPPQDNVQGPPAYSLSSNKYRPSLTIAQPVARYTTELTNIKKKEKHQYIPSLVKSIGIDNIIHQPCKDVRDTRYQYRGNGTFYNRQLVNVDTQNMNGLAPGYFSKVDRVGTFGLNKKQTQGAVLHTF